MGNLDGGAIGQFSVRRHVGLYEDGRNLRIDADREVDAGQFPGLRREHFRILRQRKRVEIHDTKKTFVFALQRDPIPQRAEIISQMHIAGWLGSAKNSFHLISTNQKDLNRNGHDHTENHPKDASEHCQD